MKSRTVIATLAILCVAEGVFIVGLVWGRAAFPPPVLELADSAQQKVFPATTSARGSTAKSGGTSTPVELQQQNEQLSAKLEEVSKELTARKSEISFSYGSVHEAGKFVGMTFRKMFETAAARETKEAQARMADNQINILSLGPFIQDAEVFESDPASFAQFQAPLISEVLSLPPERSGEVESLLADLKSKSLKVEEGSAEWMQLNETALQKVIALVPENQRPAMKSQLDFLRQYGVLMIPAYSILRATPPTIVGQ
jgi:hypothetical protein